MAYMCQFILSYLICLFGLYFHYISVNWLYFSYQGRHGSTCFQKPSTNILHWTQTWKRGRNCNTSTSEENTRAWTKILVKYRKCSQDASKNRCIIKSHKPSQPDVIEMWAHLSLQAKLCIQNITISLFNIKTHMIQVGALNICKICDAAAIFCIKALKIRNLFMFKDKLIL